RRVDAVYTDHGASLVLSQARAPHPARVAGVFCRLDAGEWTGLRNGIGVKQGLDRHRAQAEREQLRRRRARVEAALKACLATARPLWRLDAPAARQLTALAAELGGSSVAVLSTALAALLERWVLLSAEAMLIQCAWRVAAARREVHRRYLRRAETHADTLRRHAVTAIMVAATDKGAAATTAANATAANAMATNAMSAFKGPLPDPGRRFILSVHSLEHRDVPLKAAVEWWQLCPACKTQRRAHPFFCYSYARLRYEAFRGVCSCATLRPPERLLLQAYDPTDGRSVELAVTGAELRRRL
ncbi:unnamed protein product, partial [Phaeothamnion confervicola]